MSSSHAFDMQHFASVHDRELIEPPVIDCPAPFARRNSYHAKVVGQHLLDRLLNRYAGKTVRITLSVCGGTFALVTANFGGAHSRFLVSQQPLENGQSGNLGCAVVLAAPGAKADVQQSESDYLLVTPASSKGPAFHVGCWSTAAATSARKAAS